MPSNPDPYQPHRPVPGKPIISSYPTPDFNDRIYKVHKDTRAPGYVLPDAGAKFTGPNAEKYKDFLFCTAVPSDQTGWVDFVYVNERLNEDAYNFVIEYPWEDQDWPRITRTYVTLLTKYKKPDPDQVDPAFEDCVLVEQKLTRLEDPVLEVLFVGVTKIFERIPAETEVVLDRADSELPFNMRVRVPAVQVTTIEQGAVGTGDIPEIVDEEDWNISDTTRTVFSRQRKRTKRVIPNGSVSLLRGKKLTREQQLGTVSETWAVGDQSIIPRATTIESSVDDVGNNTTVKTETVVDRVFPAAEFRTEIRDLIPPKFDGLSPKITAAASEEGQASQPTLGVGELERTARQETDLIRRNQVTKRDTVGLPKTLTDYELGGIDSKGSRFGGIMQKDATLSADPLGQPIDEGFDVTDSSVENLGNSLTLKETKKLWGVQGAELLLTNPGHDFNCNPEVVFSSGQVGSDAAATAIISSVPGGGGVTPGQDPGGVFNLSPSSFGDTNGVFYFLGARYNGGTWRNPADYNIFLNSQSEPAYTIAHDQLRKIVNREQDSTIIVPVYNSGSHFVSFNLPAGATLKATHIAVQLPSVVNSTTAQHIIRVQGSNDGNTWTTLGSDLTLSFTGVKWALGGLTNINSFRHFRIFGTSTDPINGGADPAIYQNLYLSEVEFYGELTIVPGIDLGFQFNGDANGVFFYLGQRGGNGTWRNPATNGDIVASADGPLVGTVDQIVDRQPSNVYTDGNPARAYYFDLLAGRKLICDKISFLQRTNFGSATQSFILQGRNNLLDPDDWTDLATVHPSQTSDTWTTVDVEGSIGYRQFRSISPQAFFTIGELELYGQLVLGTSADTNSVTSVEITNGGHDYNTLHPPEVRFLGGGGTGAAGTAVVVNGAVVRVDMTNIGQDYTSEPDIRFFVDQGGKDAAADGILTGDTVTSYNLTDQGVEYKIAPNLVVVGDGTGATAHAVVNLYGQVVSVVADTVGSGYSFASVLFVNAGGPVAEAIVGYGIASIARVATGSAYSSPPSISVGPDGSGFQGHCILGFPILSGTMNSRGGGYTSTPGVSISGDGTGATGTAVRGFPVASVSFSPNATLFLDAPPVVVTGGGAFGAGAQFLGLIGRPVLAIIAGLGGSNYSPDTAIVITGDGSGATAHPTFSYPIDSISVDVPGGGYTVATVVIDPPTGINGIQATAHAVILAGAIDSIVIDNPGFGYLTIPNCSITGDGTLAEISATLEVNGSIDTVVVDAPGDFYTVSPVITTTGTSGSGAILNSTLNTASTGRLLKVIIIDGGHGYTSAPTLSIAGAPSPVATLGTVGEIVTVTITNGGNDFTRTASITFSGGGGSGASATGQLRTVGRLKSIVVDAPGEGWTSTPLATITGGGGTGATAAVTLLPGGKIKTLTLIEPGGPFSVAPLVSFFGCNGLDATAIYILPTGWPVLTDIITDPVEGIVVYVEKKIVPAGTPKPDGYVDIFALDKYRSIQLTSKVDLSTLPPPEHFFQSHIINLPPTLVSVAPTYNTDTSSAVGIDTRFGSTSVKSSVKGKIFVRIADGYRGPAKAAVTRTFMFGPPTEGQTPSPLIITPSTGTVYLISRGQNKDTSLGIRSGFGYIEDAISNSQDMEALDISGVLTGGLVASGQSITQVVDPSTQINDAISRAQSAGFFFDGYRTRIATNIVSAFANFVVDIPASCPRQILPGTTYLLDAGVEKWRFGIYVQTLIYITVPCPQGGNPYTYAGQQSCRACNGGQVVPGPS